MLRRLDNDNLKDACSGGSNIKYQLINYHYSEEIFSGGSKNNNNLGETCSGSYNKYLSKERHLRRLG
jgi:hypothetical protein